MTIKQRFKSSVNRGTGEAYLILIRHPKIDFSNTIIKASLNNLSYDAQSEGSRFAYILSLIAHSRQKNKIKQAVLRKLATERKDTWALVQLFDIAADFAKQGDLDAKKAIYRRLYKKVIKGSEWVGEDAVIDVDGIEGLKFIAHRKGKFLSKNHNQWDDGMLVAHFQEKNTSIKVYEELEHASRTDPFTRIYLDAIFKNKQESQTRKKTYGITKLSPTESIGM